MSNPNDTQAPPSPPPPPHPGERVLHCSNRHPPCCGSTPPPPPDARASNPPPLEELQDTGKTTSVSLLSLPPATAPTNDDGSFTPVGCTLSRWCTTSPYASIPKEVVTLPIHTANQFKPLTQEDASSTGSIAVATAADTTTIKESVMASPRGISSTWHLESEFRKN